MQLLQSRSTGRRSRHLKIVVAALVVVVTAGVWFARDPALARYRVWKQKRALEQAKGFIEKRDPLNAQLALDVALRTGPGNPDTIRAAADMLEQVGAPQAMRLRRALVQLNPDSAEDTARLVLCGLRFRDFNAAKDALSGASPEISVQQPMVQAALAYALATGNAPVADALLADLKTRAPNDPDLQHAHALLKLQHPNAAARTAAVEELELLAKSHPRLEPQIARQLAGYTLQHGEFADAKRRLVELTQRSDATLDDHLQLANVQLVHEGAAFEPIFKEIAPIAAKSEFAAAQLTQWLLVQNRAEEADRWLGQLSDSMRTTPPLLAVQADVVAQLKDWERLAFLLRAGAWGSVPKEPIQIAFAAQTVDNPTRPSLRRETWDMALTTAGGNLVTLRVLHRLASLWQWRDETERTLWSIARSFPDQTWAHQALFNLYREKKDTAAMRDVVSTLRESDGSVRRYQHDWALLTLLTQPTSNWNPAKDTMRQLHSLDPSDPSFATGYAFALAQHGKADEALAVIEKLSPEHRDYPPRQPYLAYIYGVARKAQEFERTTTLTTGANYLPEENLLFTRGREELNRKPPAPKPTKHSTENAAETKS